MEWVDKIGNLYHLNDLRLAHDKDSDDYVCADTTLRQAVDQMALAGRDQLNQPNLHPAAQKVLQSMENHWSGLTVFVDHPQIPMDNNKAERAERTPAVGRKTYYGSGSLWSGRLCWFRQLDLAHFDILIWPTPIRRFSLLPSNDRAS